MLFDDAYGRCDVFACCFAGMSVCMGLVVFTDSRLVATVGADRMMVTLLWARRHRQSPVAAAR